MVKDAITYRRQRSEPRISRSPGVCHFISSPSLIHCKRFHKQNAYCSVWISPPLDLAACLSHQESLFCRSDCPIRQGQCNPLRLRASYTSAPPEDQTSLADQLSRISIRIESHFSLEAHTRALGVLPGVPLCFVAQSFPTLRFGV
jgi:hypothetical protein